MSSSMTLVTIAHTGHVVAALTRASEGDDLDIAAIAGEDFPMRATRVDGSVDPQLVAWLPADILEVKTAPYDPSVIASPSAYAINGGAPARLNAATPAPAVAVDPSTVTVPADTADIPILVVVSDPDDPIGTRRVQSGKHDSDIGTNPDTELPLTLVPATKDVPAVPAGLTAGTDYQIMTAVAGELPLFSKDTA